MGVIKTGLKNGKGGGGWGQNAFELMMQVMGGKGGGGWGKGGGSWNNNKNTGKFKVDKSGGVVGEFTGTIKSFGWKQNYGFIECEEAGQGDIFLHGDMKKGYQQGQIVKFTCVLNKDGKAVAIDLKSGLSGGSGGKSKISSTSSSSGSGKFQVDQSGGVVGEFVGTIKSFGWQKNYGFIECEEAGQGDIFLHGDMKKGYQQGQTVKFTCVLNKDGKAVAIDLKSGLK